MNKTYRTLALGILAVMLIVGISAMWADSLRTNVTVKTGKVDIRFNTPPTYLDACGLPPAYGQSGGYDYNASNFPLGDAVQLGKDVGCTNVILQDTDGDGDLDTMNVTIHNAYPWYYTHIAFKVTNDGTIPVKIWRIIITTINGNQTYYEINAEGVEQGANLDLNGDGKADVRMWWGDNFGAQLEPNQPADISLDLVVLQQAPQNADLSFTITLQAIQWNEYSAQIPQ